MQNIQHFIFDLDGTITSPQPGIVGGYRFAFEKLGFPYKPDEEIIPLIGPSLRHVFSNIYHLSAEDVDSGIRYYREYYYSNGGMYEAFIFDGMKALFQSLKDKNKTLHVATNKALQVDDILAHFEVLDYFTCIEHYNEEKNIVTKERMIENILLYSNIRDKKTVVMIGDRKHDLAAAKNVGIRSIGVLYGFGGREELENCEPDFIVNDVAELHSVLHQF